MNNTITISGSEAIAKTRLIVLRSAVKLEGLGMKRRGESATKIAKRELGLSKGASRGTVMAKLNELIAA